MINLYKNNSNNNKVIANEVANNNEKAKNNKIYKALKPLYIVNGIFLILIAVLTAASVIILNVSSNKTGTTPMRSLYKSVILINIIFLIIPLSICILQTTCSTKNFKKDGKWMIYSWIIWLLLTILPIIACIDFNSTSDFSERKFWTLLLSNASQQIIFGIISFFSFDEPETGIWVGFIPALILIIAATFMYALFGLIYRLNHDEKSINLYPFIFNMAIMSIVSCFDYVVLLVFKIIWCSRNKTNKYRGKALAIYISSLVFGLICLSASCPGVILSSSKFVNRFWIVFIVLIIGQIGLFVLLAFNIKSRNFEPNV